MSAARYFLPVPDAEGSQQVMMALAKDLLAKDRVALVRYAYNANSNPKVACLMPKVTKHGVPVSLNPADEAVLSRCLSTTSCRSARTFATLSFRR